MYNKTISLIVLSAAVIVLGAACGKKAVVNNNSAAVDLNPTTNTVVIPSGNTTGDFSTVTNTTATVMTVKITAAGVSPKTLTVSAGKTVTFVNEDTIAHQVSSNPHPTHTDLPGFDNTGLSQSYSFTFSKPGSFGYHDHLDPFNTAMQGTIVVQ